MVICSPSKMFAEADFDESEYALLVSRRYETRHHRLEVRGALFADSLPRMVWHNDEPLNHPNSVQIPSRAVETRPPASPATAGATAPRPGIRSRRW